jgi:outer membrane protein assembly factor BamB
MLLILSTGLYPAAQETANRNTTQATVSRIPSPAASGSATNTPLWQTRLNVEETDFIQFVSKDRVLVGTVHVHPLMGGEVSPHEIMLLNSVTGETVWAVSREHYAFPQSILAVSPLIILQGSNQIVALNLAKGSNQIVALNPANGAQIWNLESASSESLFLPSQNLIVFINHKPPPMSLVAVDIKTGNEVWKTPVENYPQGKEAKTELATMGGSVLLSGPEVAAFSVANGKLLWRMPFPGKYGAKATAIPLGDDLYFSDDAVISRADPASGKQMWSVPIADGGFQALTSDGRNAFTLLKGSAERAPNSIAALDRNTGKQLWKSDLLDRAASPITIEGDRLYVTTPANVIAMRASDGSMVFRAEIPACLQSRRQLPDHLRISTDRIIVAREDGVLAVQKGDGKLLFADAVPGGKGFTYDYATNRFLHASLNAAPRKKNHPTELNAESASPDETYRVAAGQQRFAYIQSAAVIQSQIAMTNWMTTGYAQPTYQQQQAAAGGAALAGSITNAALGIAGAFNKLYLEFLRQSYQIRAQQTFQTHAVSLQDKLHIRPSYRQPQGWSLHVVNLETGEHADILLSSDADLKPHVLAPNLPAFSADGLRIVSRGLGPNTEQVKKRVGLGHAMVTYPSVLAFDLSSLHFEPASMAPASVAKPAEAAKNTPDHRLLEAAYQGDLDAAKKALDSGANVNAADEYGNTALMLAAEASPGTNDHVVKLLLEKGADADARDPSGLTAWQHTHLLVGTATKGIFGSEKAINKAQRTKVNTRSWLD